MKRFNVKFFGSKNRKEQIKQVKTVVQATSKVEVESVLRYKLGYEVINGLKIREVIDEY
jgi:hypothetical protein